MQLSVQQELFISEQQFDSFLRQLRSLDLTPVVPLEQQAFPRHFDLVYKGKCVVHFDYVGQTLDFHVRALIEDGELRFNPPGDYSLVLQELRKRIARTLK